MKVIMIGVNAMCSTMVKALLAKVEKGGGSRCNVKIEKDPMVAI